MDVDLCHNLQSLLYLPFAIANALTAKLNDGYVDIYIYIHTYLIQLNERKIYPSVSLHSGMSLHLIQAIGLSPLMKVPSFVTEFP